MSIWQKFYYSWGLAAAALVVTVLIVLAVPIAIPFAAATLVPILAMGAIYGSFFVRCPKCGVRLAETVLSHGPPGEQCPLCLYDLKAPDSTAVPR
jgi:hypothetical protein